VIQEEFFSGFSFGRAWLIFHRTNIPAKTNICKYFCPVKNKLDGAMPNLTEIT
jgi:hypothetical protein